MKKLVGLTGKTGAGKSTVSEYFSKKGAYIIDGDIVAREVLRADENLITRLCDAFGDILNEDGTLNRKKLASLAFSSAENTEKLNSVMHPAINNLIKIRAEKAFENHDVVIVDAAAIIESGFADDCDVLVVVHAPFSVRKKRIIKRDSLSEKDALIRMNGQKDDDFYLSRADFVVRNYEPYNLENELSRLEKELFAF
ncbi:MAG: dephospho-CoA kinase [Clostridia bacterium]|nr:dephospho-CoA kinase [Clostridia bacterium]